MEYPKHPFMTSSSAIWSNRARKMENAHTCSQAQVSHVDMRVFTLRLRCASRALGGSSMCSGLTQNVHSVSISSESACSSRTASPWRPTFSHAQRTRSSVAVSMPSFIMQPHRIMQPHALSSPQAPHSHLGHVVLVISSSGQSKLRRRAILTPVRACKRQASASQAHAARHEATGMQVRTEAM